ncbi:MAG: hypothetical protein WBM16_12010, partial [Pseudolabrys sp.]
MLRIGREQGWDKSRYGQDLLGNPVKHVRPVATLGCLALTCFLQPIGRYNIERVLGDHKFFVG